SAMTAVVIVMSKGPDAGRLSECLEGDDRARVLDARYGLHLLVDEVADVGLLLDVKLHQQVEIPGGRIDLGGELGIRELVGDFVRLAELAFDLNEEGDHSRLQCGLGRGAIQQIRLGEARAGLSSSRYH